MTPSIGQRPPERMTALVVATGASALFAIVALLGLALDGDVLGFDQRILLALRSDGDVADPIGPKWLQGYMRDVTALGGFPVLSILVLGVAGFLAASGRRVMALRIFAVSLSGWLLMNGIKFLVQRPRPDLVPHGADVYASSFPSGHAMTSAVVYLTLAAALARASDDAQVRTFIMVFAIALIAMIGFSRVYLGVHWPTDVLAGWALGAAWAGLAWTAFERFDRADLTTGH